MKFDPERDERSSHFVQPFETEVFLHNHLF